MKHKSRGRKSARKSVRRGEKRFLTVVCILLALIVLGLSCYAAGWYANRARIRGSAARYRSMYSPAPVETAAPVPTPTDVPSPTPTDVPSPTPFDTPLPTPVPTEAPSPTPTEAPQVETPLPTSVVIHHAPAVTEAPMPTAIDEPIPTPNADTLVLALPSAPPVQASFAELLAHNPDTVGYLEIPDLLSLPVVQREDDNEYYLDHNFDGEEAREGALFLDGVNRLVPEDDCLIVYGHNMKNGTMFGSLDDFQDVGFVKEHALVRFDTLYENRLYAPFAAFTASMDREDRHYFEVRRFLFDETEFELFTLKLQARSALRLPVDVRYGDRLLLLVTCDSSRRTDRFVLALRQLRADETEDDMRELMQEAK